VKLIALAAATLVSSSAAQAAPASHMRIQFWTGYADREAMAERNVLSGKPSKATFKFGDDVLVTVIFKIVKSCVVQLEMAGTAWASRTPSSWPFEARSNDSFEVAFEFGHETYKVGGTVHGSGVCTNHLTIGSSDRGSRLR
jgi:hypothetical protein